jgi:hypothetical protein
MTERAKGASQPSEGAMELAAELRAIWWRQDHVDAAVKEQRTKAIIDSYLSEMVQAAERIVSRVPQSANAEHVRLQRGAGCSCNSCELDRAAAALAKWRPK